MGEVVMPAHGRAPADNIDSNSFVKPGEDSGPTIEEVETPIKDPQIPEFEIDFRGDPTGLKATGDQKEEEAETKAENVTPIKPPKSFISSTFKSIGKVFATKPPSALPTPSVSTPAFEPEPPPVFDLAPAMVPVPSPTPVLEDSAVEEIKERPKRAPKPTISIKEQQEESKRRHDIITTTPPTEINLTSLNKDELKL